MPVILPFPLTDGTVARGSEVKANDDVLAAKFSSGAGGISNSDIYTGAAIDGTKLSSVNQVPEDRLAQNSVSERVLRQDAITDGQRPVVTNSIRNNAVTKDKIAAGQITKAQLAAQYQSVTKNLTGAGLYISIAPAIVVVTGAPNHYEIQCEALRYVSGSMVLDLFNMIPVTPIDSTANTVLAVYFTSYGTHPGAGIGTGTINLVATIVSIPNT